MPHEAPKPDNEKIVEAYKQEEWTMNEVKIAVLQLESCNLYLATWRKSRNFLR